jgi:hypothetical protein
MLSLEKLLLKVYVEASVEVKPDARAGKRAESYAILLRVD